MCIRDRIINIAIVRKAKWLKNSRVHKLSLIESSENPKLLEIISWLIQLANGICLKGCQQPSEHLTNCIIPTYIETTFSKYGGIIVINIISDQFCIASKMIINILGSLLVWQWIPCIKIAAEDPNRVILQIARIINKTKISEIFSIIYSLLG